MAVEKSYTRLGLFLVIALIVALGTGLLFIQRMRSREVIELVTYTQENVAGLDISSPVRYRGVPVGRVSDLQVEPGGRTIEIDFELFTDRLTTVGANVTNLQELAPRACFRAAARSGGGQPRDRRGLPLSRHAGEPPSADGARLHAKPAIHPVDADADCGATGPVARSAGARRGDAPGASADRRPDARQPRPGRPVLHQRRTHRPRERAAGPQRRLAEVLLDDQRADRGDGLEAERAGRQRGHARRSSPNEARAAIDAADLPGSSHATHEAMDQASLAAQDLRRSLPAMRESLGQLRELARQLQEQPESVVHGTRQAGAKPK